MRGRSLLAAAAASLLCGCGAGVKTVVRDGLAPSAKVAVMPFSGRDKDTGLSLAEAFTTYLMDDGFDVMERAQLESVLKEQKMSLSGAMGPGDLEQIGRLTGISAVVTGSYQVREERVRTVTPKVVLPPPPGKPNKRPLRPVRQVPGEVRTETATVFRGLTVKFVDVNTGRVLLSCSSEKEYAADSVNEALAAMAKSIKKELEKRKGD
ncbi:MAG: hypothetical protein M0025_02635 [Elusimicrobia bacterium]|nr:hypothetical protein [Elusimicrobiota bacterium]